MKLKEKILRVSECYLMFQCQVWVDWSLIRSLLNTQQLSSRRNIRSTCVRMKRLGSNYCISVLMPRRCYQPIRKWMFMWKLWPMESTSILSSNEKCLSNLPFSKLLSRNFKKQLTRQALLRIKLIQWKSSVEPVELQSSTRLSSNFSSQLRLAHILMATSLWLLERPLELLTLA